MGDMADQSIDDGLDPKSEANETMRGSRTVGVHSRIKCPECGSPMVLRRSRQYRYENGNQRLFYGCSTWPLCVATHGARPDGKPEGIPADKETREARVEAHKVFDRLWEGGDMDRNHAYRILQDLTGMKRADCHFSKFTKNKCNNVIKILNNYMKNK